MICWVIYYILWLIRLTECKLPNEHLIKPDSSNTCVEQCIRVIVCLHISGNTESYLFIHTISYRCDFMYNVQCTYNNISELNIGNERHNERTNLIIPCAWSNK